MNESHQIGPIDLMANLSIFPLSVCLLVDLSVVPKFANEQK